MLILFFPILSFVIVGLFGRYLGKNGAALLTVPFTALSFFTAISYFRAVGFGRQTYVFNLGDWFDLISFGFLFDPLSVTMAVLVSGITTLVQLYSLGYMGHDPHLPRKFLAYLSFFAGCMLLMVLSGNFVLFFFGWEGVGLSSYLLINFWYTRNQANKGALKAIIFNRVGDISLFLVISLCFVLARSSNFAVIQMVIPRVDIHHHWLVVTLSFFIFLAAIAKSAQLFLHPWLPDLWKDRLL